LDATALLEGELLLKGDRRPADSLPREVDGHLDAVGDRDERDAFIHRRPLYP
jgi:hypothetical protein